MPVTILSCLYDFVHLFYPHNCEGCGSEVLGRSGHLCATCMHQLPVTGFFNAAHNPIERSFYGRLPIVCGAAAFYFTKDSLLQHLMVQLKYKGNKETGYFLGRMMGHVLQQSARFAETDILVPLPLNPRKEYKRGYNQALLICQGIYSIWPKPVLNNAVVRVRFTETQTKQNRLSRWQNMAGVFEIRNPKALENKHLLLVDDVITTGATLEACGAALLKIPGVRLSVAAAAYTI